MVKMVNSTKRDLAIRLILRNCTLPIEDKLTLQEIADECGLTLMQICCVYDDISDVVSDMMAQ